MSSEDDKLRESKLHHLGVLDLDRGLTWEESVVQKKLFQEYVEIKQGEYQDDKTTE